MSLQTTAALIATPALGKATPDDTIDSAKVKQIDQLVTTLLLNKVYTPKAVASKHLRDTVRSVLAA